MAVTPSSSQAAPLSLKREEDAAMMTTDSNPSVPYISIEQLAQELHLTVEFLGEVVMDKDLPFAPPPDPASHKFTPWEANAVRSFIGENYLPDWTEPFGPLSSDELRALRDGMVKPLRLNHV